MTTHEGKIPATLTVLTKNSAKTLEKNLESAKDFDDIVVCDGGSTDGTLEIAKRYGANIIAQNPALLEDGKIFDFAGVRNQTFEAAKHNWIFWLDSDEYAGEDLVAAIRRVISERGVEGNGAFWVNRKYVLSGTVIDCASTYPNRQMRFFAKNSTTGFVKRIHERIKLKPEVQAEYLGGFMYLPTDDDIPAIRRKWDYQIAVAVAQSGRITVWQFIQAAFDNAKVSTLWIFRHLRNALFCSGTKMPFKFEMERHRFHIKLLGALASEVYIGKYRLASFLNGPPSASVFDFRLILRFLISGGTAAAVNLFLLYLFTSIFGVWYVYSAIVAYLLSFVVSFLLQKIWTFKHKSLSATKHQLPLYFAVQTFDLFVASYGLYLVVEYLHVWYLFAAVGLSAIIAIWNFFIFKLIIFRHR